MIIEKNYDGVEKEQEGTEPILRPFDPTLIRVATKILTVDILMKRIKHGELDLMPDFQRKGGIWNTTAKSRLIESLLIRIPIPAFYFDGTDEDKWVVVDGMQRLNTIKEFVDGCFALTNLEFLREYNNSKHKEFPRHMKRRIEETQFTIYLIEKGTPDRVKLDIFERINTGGLPLSSQEIRHALHADPARAFLKELAGNEDFLAATGRGISDKRMMDREFALRFLAFTHNGYMNYKDSDIDGFLHNSMRQMNQISDSERAELKCRFIKAMRAAKRIFDNDAFRKRFNREAARSPINKSLFEAWSVNFGALKEEQLNKLWSKKDLLMNKFIDLMNTDNTFVQSITQGTGSSTKVANRFKAIEKLLKEILE